MDVGPTIPGHEPLGIIEEVGERAAQRWGVEPGDRVAVEPLIPCGECEACREGLRTRCSGWGRMYSYGLLGTEVEPGLLGGYAEYMYLHPNTVMHKMPREMPASVAVLFNPLGGGRALGDDDARPEAGRHDRRPRRRPARPRLRDRRPRRGAGKIIVTDLARAANKLEFARELGADATIVADEEDVVARVIDLTGGRGADVVVDVTPVATQPILDAVDVRPQRRHDRPQRRQGRAAGGARHRRGGAQVDHDARRLHRRLAGLPARDPAARKRRPPFERLHTASYPLERAEEAIHHLAGRLDGPPAIDVAIAPGGNRERGRSEDPGPGVPRSLPRGARRRTPNSRQEARWFDGSILIGDGDETAVGEGLPRQGDRHARIRAGLRLHLQALRLGAAWEMLGSGERTFTDLVSAGSRYLDSMEEIEPAGGGYRPPELAIEGNGVEAGRMHIATMHLARAFARTVVDERGAGMSAREITGRYV